MAMNERGKLYADAAGLGLLCLILIALNVCWILRNDYVCVDDDWIYLNDSIYTYHQINRTDLGLFAPPMQDRLRHFSLLNLRFPPVTYVMSWPWYSVLGVDKKVAQMSLVPFLVIYLLSLFFLGRHLGGRALAWIMVLCAGSSPLMLTYSRYYLLDFPVASMSALALCLLFLSEGFSRRTPSLLFGTALGVALLTKHLAAFFIGPITLLYWLYLLHRGAPTALRVVGAFMPVLYVFGIYATGVCVENLMKEHATLFHQRLPLVLSVYFECAVLGVFALSRIHRSVRSSANPFSVRLSNMAMALWIAGSIAAWWYALNAADMISYAREVSVNSGSGPSITQTGMSFLPLVPSFSCLAVVTLPLGALSLALSHSTRNACLLAAVGLLAGLGLCCLNAAYLARYFLPAFPLIAVLSLAWIVDFEGIKKLLIWLAVPLFVYQAAGWMVDRGTASTNCVHRLGGHMPGSGWQKGGWGQDVPVSGLEPEIGRAVDLLQERMPGDKGVRLKIAMLMAQSNWTQLLTYYSIVRELPLEFATLDKRRGLSPVPSGCKYFVDFDEDALADRTAVEQHHGIRFVLKHTIDFRLLEEHTMRIYQVGRAQGPDD